MPKTKPSTTIEYIDSAPKEAQEKLNEIRAILKKVAPNATETLKWGSPVFEEKRILFSYSAFKSHLNFMPTHSALEPFKEELTGYKTGKDTIQFPYNKPQQNSFLKSLHLESMTLERMMHYGCTKTNYCDTLLIPKTYSTSNFRLHTISLRS